MSLVEAVKFNADGLVVAIVQDRFSGQVLMQAWMNADALAQTLETGIATFWSRSRGEIWVKGATSGHTQKVVDVRLDCDADSLLLVVEPAGPACHTGQFSCFYRQAQAGQWQEQSVPEIGLLSVLAELLEARKSASADSSYVASLYAKGRDKILQKLGEEAIETVIAGKSDVAADLIYEMADLWFHALVLLADAGLHPKDILQELDRRMGVSGLAEKAARTAGES